jgi:8-oxo-dGTP diphosphatase
MKSERPRYGIAVGVIVVKDGKVLFLKRKGSFGHGTWSVPGGNLEHGESTVECAKREVMEEAGIKVKNIRKAYFINDVDREGEDPYVILFVIAEYDSGEVRVMEPEFSEKLEWFDWYNLPEPLFDPIKILIEEGFDPIKHKCLEE